MAIRPEGQILVDFSALRAGFSTHIQWREGDTAQPNIHIQWSASPVGGYLLPDTPVEPVTRPRLRELHPQVCSPVESSQVS